MVLAYDSTVEFLRRLPELHEMCAAALTAERRPFTERVSGHLPRGIALNEHAVATRSDILETLVSWSSRVAGERRLAGPCGRRVPQLVNFLDRHLDWLLGRTTAPRFSARRMVKDYMELLYAPAGSRSGTAP
jgi:hypothetical protein